MAVWFWPVAVPKAVSVCLPKGRYSPVDIGSKPVASKSIKLGRLKKRSEFLYVRDGCYQARPSIVIQMRAQQDPTGGINVGFTATKKIGNAVVRNRCKRRLRELARDFLPVHGKPGHDYVFIARASTAKAEWADLQKDVEKALLRLA